MQHRRWVWQVRSPDALRPCRHGCTKGCASCASQLPLLARRRSVRVSLEAAHCTDYFFIPGRPSGSPEHEADGGCPVCCSTYTVLSQVSTYVHGARSPSSGRSIDAGRSSDLVHPGREPQRCWRLLAHDGGLGQAGRRMSRQPAGSPLTLWRTGFMQRNAADTAGFCHRHRRRPMENR